MYSLSVCFCLFLRLKAQIIFNQKMSVVLQFVCGVTLCALPSFFVLLYFPVIGWVFFSFGGVGVGGIILFHKAKLQHFQHSKLKRKFHVKRFISV